MTSKAEKFTLETNEIPPNLHSIEVSDDDRKRFLPKIIKHIKASLNNSLSTELCIASEAYEDVRSCLDKIKTSVALSESGEEKSESHLEEIVLPISEHLLDKITKCYEENVDKGEDQYALAVAETNKLLVFSYKIIYLITIIFGSKRVINVFNIESKNLELVTLFAHYLPADRECWEAVHFFAMWLSRLCLIPFDIESMDNQIFGKKLVDRLLELAKSYSFSHGEESSPGSMFLTMLISRADLNASIFDSTFALIIEKAYSSPASTSTREVNCALNILNKIFKMSKKKLYLHKIPQLIELSNFIYDNLDSHAAPTIAQLVKLNMNITMTLIRHGDECIRKVDVVDVIETTGKATGPQSYHIHIIQALLKRTIFFLDYRNYEVRFKSARSIALLTRLLGPRMKSILVISIINIFSIDNSSVMDEEFGPIRNFHVVSENLWHGACLAIREMLALSCIPETMLNKVLTVLRGALSFHYRSGDSEIGMHVREAACNALWCLMTHYSQTVLKKLAKTILNPLIILSLLDKEITVRRAATTSLNKLLEKIPSCTENAEYFISNINYYTISNKNNSMGPLTLRICERDESVIKDILKAIFFRCLDSRDKNIRMITASTLATITVNYRKWSESVLKRLIILLTSKCGYAVHGATCSLQNIYNLLKSPDMCPDLLYLSTFSALSSSKKAERRVVKLDILRSIASCRLITEITSNPAHLDFFIAYSKSKNLKFNEFIWGLLFTALENTDLFLEKEASLSALSASKSKLALSKSRLANDIFSVLMNPDMAKGSTLRKVVLLLLNTANLDESEVEISVERLCEMATRKLSFNKHFFDYKIRNLIVKNLVNVFNMYVHKNPSVEVYKKCFKRMVLCAINLLDDYTISHEGDVGSKIRADASNFLTHISPYVYTIAVQRNIKYSLEDTSKLPEFYIDPEDMQTCVCKLIRLSIEKINTVREAVLITINEILSNKFIQFKDKQVLIEIVPKNFCYYKINSKDYFDKFAQLIKYKEWRKAALNGFITGYGSLSKSITDPCNSSLRKLSNEICSRVDSSAPPISETSAEDFINLLTTITLENKNCFRLYNPSLELLEFFAYNEMLTKYSSIADIKILIEFLKTRLEISQNYREICSILKICTYMGSQLVTCNLDAVKAPILYDFLGLAISGLSHAYPRVREIVTEHIYTSLSVSLLYRSNDPRKEYNCELLDCLFSEISSPVTDEEAEKVKAQVINIMRPYLDSNNTIEHNVCAGTSSET